MESRLHIPFSSQLQAEANASYDDSNVCQDIIPTVVENHQARYNLDRHALRSSLPLPNNAELGYAGEEDAAVEWNTRFAPNQHHRTYPLLPMEQYNTTRHSDSTFNPCDPNLLRNQWTQEQNAYTQSHIKLLPAYAADPVQEQRKYSEDSENYDPSYNIQIAAPVPLSFSARSKDVLYSMISNSSQSESVCLEVFRYGYTDGLVVELYTEAIPLEYSTFSSPPVFRQHPQETEQVVQFLPSLSILLTNPIFIPRTLFPLRPPFVTPTLWSRRPRTSSCPPPAPNYLMPTMVSSQDTPPQTPVPSKSTYRHPQTLTICKFIINRNMSKQNPSNRYHLQR